MAEPPPTYTREEMDAILKRAIERQQAKSEGIGHEDLVAAAGEVGIPREEVEAAARDLEAERATGRQPQPPARSGTITRPDENRTRAMRKLARSAMTYSVLTMFFVFLCHQTGAHWWIWPALGMAISLVLQASRAIFGDPRARDGRPSLVVGVSFLPGDRQEREERRADRRVSRGERMRMRRVDRLADFERKVAIGADALIRVIEEAKRVKARLEDEPRSAGPAPREPGQRVRVPSPPPKVETREADEAEHEAGEGGRVRREL